MLTRKTLGSAKRIVVKVGTSTLTDKTGKLDYHRTGCLAKELTFFSKQGKDIVLVTSAAVSAGVERMGLKQRPKTIPQKQAAAAVGQGILMHAYEKSFADYNQIVAQILMTREDSVKRKNYINLRNTFNSLFASSIIPIVNENDAIAIDELKIGDNDTLSAQVASLVDADLLIILSDIQGLYTANPAQDKSAKLIGEVAIIDQKIEQSAGGAGSARGTGGMMTKIQAAKIVVNSGIAMIIACGSQEDVIKKVLSGKQIGTLFLSRKDKLRFKKRWLAFGTRIKGKVYVDDGCKVALKKGSSLLPAGIVSITGDFSAGNTISIYDSLDKELARGLTNYSSEEIALIKGSKTAQIDKILGYKSFDEVVHRDNLVVLMGDDK